MATIHPLRIKKLLREDLGVSNVRLVKDEYGKDVVETGTHPLYGLYAKVTVVNRRREGSYRVYYNKIMFGENMGKHVVKLSN